MTERRNTDVLFKALADPSRRKLLDLLHAHDGRTLRELCDHLDMSRQGVTQHLAVLEAANLVATLRRGREKLHFLNPVPCRRSTSAGLPSSKGRGSRRFRISNDDWRKAMAKSTYVYVSYIRTTPEKLWAALTDDKFIEQYWFGMHSECQFTKGSPWKLASGDGTL